MVTMSTVPLMMDVKGVDDDDFAYDSAYPNNVAHQNGVYEESIQSSTHAVVSPSFLFIYTSDTFNAHIIIHKS